MSKDIDTKKLMANNQKQLKEEEFEMENIYPKNLIGLFKLLSFPELDDNSLVEKLASILLNRKGLKYGPDFLESLELEKLSSEDQAKLYKKALSLIGEGVKAYAKSGGMRSELRKLLGIRIVNGQCYRSTSWSPEKAFDEFLQSSAERRRDYV